MGYFLDNHPDIRDVVILLILTDVMDDRVHERFDPVQVE